MVSGNQLRFSKKKIGMFHFDWIWISYWAVIIQNLSKNFSKITKNEQIYWFQFI